MPVTLKPAPSTVARSMSSVTKKIGVDSGLLLLKAHFNGINAGQCLEGFFDGLSAVSAVHAFDVNDF